MRNELKTPQSVASADRPYRPAGTVNTSGTNCWGETYGIDAWGNLSSLALPSSYSSSCSHETPFSYTIPNSNQLPSASGFTYDAAGNLMATGLGNYVYNAEHQMTSATVGSVTTTYSYDGDGKRIEKSGGKIYWYGGGSDALDETDLSGNTNNATFSEYVPFGGKRIARRDYQNNIFYYFADHLGTSREMVQAGQTSPCYDADFYAYGGENAHTTTCTQNYKFTAKERDTESGLDNFGARNYASSFGRFIAPDWVEHPEAVPYANIRDPQTLNLYAYVRNNPLEDTDGDGHCPNCVAAGVGALVGGAIGAGSEYVGAKLAHREVTGKQLWGAAAKGAVTGAAAGFTMGGSLLVTTTVVATANVVGGTVDRTIQGQSTKDVLNAKEMGKDAVSGAIGGFVGGKADTAGEALAAGMREMASTPGAVTAEDAAQLNQTAAFVSANSSGVSKGVGAALDFIQGTVEGFFSGSPPPPPPPLPPSPTQTSSCASQGTGNCQAH
jgi:RHS repeat-associated protein